jgi:hypothetical protein
VLYRNLITVAIVLGLGVQSVGAQPGEAGGPALAPELVGLGSLDYRVTTAVPRAQLFFNQGLRLLYGFNHTEALRAFREAARLDGLLAMAYWGQALALGPNLNAPMPVENEPVAHEAIRRAQAAAASASERERALIAALARRYAVGGKSDRRQLDSAYAAAMTELAGRYPDDAEIQTLYADAVMNTMPWDYWQKNGDPKPEIARVIAAVERVIARDPEHAGAHHYYIHLMEASETPDRAEASADRLGLLMPAGTWCTCRRTSISAWAGTPMPPKRTSAPSPPTRTTSRSARRRGCIR